MTQRTTKTITLSLPPSMVDEIDRVRRHEHRTQSELVRDALLHYIAIAGTLGAVRVEDAQPDEIDAIHRGRDDLVRGETIRLEDLQDELGLPTRSLCITRLPIDASGRSSPYQPGPQ